jgi:hypothetical protein
MLKCSSQWPSTHVLLPALATVGDGGVPYDLGLEKAVREGRPRGGRGESTKEEVPTCVAAGPAAPGEDRPPCSGRHRRRPRAIPVPRWATAAVLAPSLCRAGPPPPSPRRARLPPSSSLRRPSAAPGLRRRRPRGIPAPRRAAAASLRPSPRQAASCRLHVVLAATASRRPGGEKGEEAAAGG